MANRHGHAPETIPLFPGSISAEQLKAIRLGLGLSQEDFAAELGMRRKSLNRLENGRRGVSGTVSRLALVLAEQGQAGGPGMPSFDLLFRRHCPVSWVVPLDED